MYDFSKKIRDFSFFCIAMDTMTMIFFKKIVFVIFASEQCKSGQNTS